MSKRTYKNKIDDTTIIIKTLKNRIGTKISTSKIEKFNEDPLEDNKPLYMFMYDTDLYINIQLLEKLLNDIKASDIDFDGTAVEFMLDVITEGLQAADRELVAEQKTREWYKKMENIGKRLEKLLNTLLNMLSANIYSLKVDQIQQVWK